MQTVILKREQTAQELAEANAAEAAAAASSGIAQVTMNGSNGHLNTGKSFSIIFIFISNAQFSAHLYIVLLHTFTPCMLLSIIFIIVVLACF